MSHRPRKRFGQNFLRDQNIISKIIEYINPDPSDTLVEIGPGQGALTEHLIDSCKSLHLVEIDRDLVSLLRNKYGHIDTLKVHAKDALKFNFSELADHGKIRVVGNLPYNISTPLIFHLLDYKSCIQDMHFMLQKEVVDRMAAEVGNKTYGRLSIMTQLFTEVDKLFDVPPTAFYPSPKVYSSVVRLGIREQPIATINDYNIFKQTVDACFSKRRKTIRNILKDKLCVDDIEKLGLTPTQRPETLDIQNFADIANHIAAHTKT
jgi:16S rRNA (adenine1518-N6/adenine1519-N6)-dimethyltransferase